MRTFLHKMGILAGFKCGVCGYEFPFHADNCQYHPGNLK